MPQKPWRRGNKARKGFDEVDNVVEKSWEFMERQNVRPLTELNSRCICERSMTPLLCTSCKKTYYGRIGRTCTEHPNVLYLQDLQACFNCSSKTLIEIDEKTLTSMNQMKR